MIVVGVDGSSGSRAALQWGVEHAQVHGTDVLAVLVAEPLSDLVVHTTEVEQRDGEQRSLLEGIVEPIAADIAVPIRCEVVHGHPAEALIQAANAAGALVVGRRGLSGLSALVLGSVSRQVTTHAQVPTVIVPLETARLLDRIVVGIDGSEDAHRAALWAAKEAVARNLPLLVLHAFQEAPVIALAGPSATMLSDDLSEAAEAVLHDELRQLVDAEPRLKVDARTVRGDSSVVLADAVSPSELLVVGAQGHGRAVSFLLGSTTARCVHTAPCPVAVIP